MSRRADDLAYFYHTHTSLPASQIWASKSLELSEITSTGTTSSNSIEYVMNANAKSPGDDDQKESHKALSLDFPSMSHQERCKYKFPVKLYAALANPEVSDVISWLPHGRSWIVRKPKEFVEKVSSKYFGYTKFSSFTRTANSWGFYRLKAGFDQGSYYNEVSA